MIGVVLGTCWKDQVGLPDGVLNIRRNHLYDGYTVEEATNPIGSARDMGCHTVIFTNACGSVNSSFKVGELVCISDHLNMTGVCPAVGFQTLADVWTVLPKYRTAVFAQVRGPAFETPAEAKMLRTLGADIVGMSTVIEAIAARAYGMKTIGLSLITDTAGTSQGHADVLKAGKKVDLNSVMRGVLSSLAVMA